MIRAVSSYVQDEKKDIKGKYVRYHVKNRGNMTN